MMLWRSRTCILAALLALLLPAATAGAETAITAQAVADNGAFLPYAPAPAQLAGLCLVDTGVNLNPDTEGVVVERTALDGGSGEDVSPTLHGTVLAMMAGAPANGWGMVGTAPRSHPDRVRANPRARTDDVPVQRLRIGNHRMPRTAAQVQHPGNQPVARHLRSAAPRESYEMLGNAVQKSERTTASRSSPPRATTMAARSSTPPRTLDVLSVGATDTQGGGFCSFSNRGEGLRLLAPGCDLDGAEPTTGAPNYNYWQGTSEASAIAAAALDALDSYQPGLSPEAAEKDLTEADNGVLDIAQTFRNAGLGAIVTAGEAAEPGAQSNSTPGSSPQPVTPLTAMTLTQPFGRPQARLKRVRHRLVLALTGRPSEAQVQVRYLGHGDDRADCACCARFTAPSRA